MTDPLRWADIALAALLVLSCGAGLVLCTGGTWQRLRILGTGVLAVGLTGGQLGALGRAYTPWTWTLGAGLAITLAGMGALVWKRGQL